MWETIKSKLLIIGLCIVIPLVVALVGVGIWSALDKAQTDPKIEELAGTWEGRVESDVSWEDIFEWLEFYDKEIEILRDNQLLDQNVWIVETATFTKDRKFCISSNTDKTKQIVKEYFEQAFDMLYDKRDQLRISYDTDFSSYTKDEFFKLYAEMYAYDTYEQLLEGLSAELADFYTVQEGEYKINGNLILTRESKDHQEFFMEYKIASGVLYLTYSADTDNPVVVAYNRVD